MQTKTGHIYRTCGRSKSKSRVQLGFQVRIWVMARASTASTSMMMANENGKKIHQPRIARDRKQY